MKFGLRGTSRVCRGRHGKSAWWNLGLILHRSVGLYGDGKERDGTTIATDGQSTCPLTSAMVGLKGDLQRRELKETSQRFDKIFFRGGGCSRII